MNEWFIWLVGSIAVFLILLIKLMVKIVPQSEEWTVERFGKFTKTLKSGLNIIHPNMDIVTHKLDMREQVMNLPSQEFVIKGNILIKVNIILFYQVQDVEKAAYQLKNLENALLHLTMSNIRIVVGSMSLDEVLSQLAQISHQMLNAINEATNPWGIKMLCVEIKDISHSKI